MKALIASLTVAAAIFAAPAAKAETHYLNDAAIAMPANWRMDHAPYHVAAPSFGFSMDLFRTPTP